MKKNHSIITENNHSSACTHIQKKFHAHSWWPRAQPRLAKQEFDLMKNSPEALEVWCKRWLDSSQLIGLIRKLQKYT